MLSEWYSSRYSMILNSEKPVHDISWKVTLLRCAFGENAFAGRFGLKYTSNFAFSVASRMLQELSKSLYNHPLMNRRHQVLRSCPVPVLPFRVRTRV